MNQYRVDRAEETKTAPVGMNSIIYLGDSYKEASRCFRTTTGGKDAWNQPNQDYGVMLSKWNGQDYVSQFWKSQCT